MDDEALVNVYQARDILGVSVRTIYNMIRDGRLIRGKRNTSMVTRESVDLQWTIQQSKHFDRFLKSGEV